VGRQARSQARPASWLGQEVGRRPVKARKFIFSFFFYANNPQNPILSTKVPFSQVDPKTKVIQNFILYNITLGYILKFQIDFEIGI
jgi:hypothetical protein